MMCCKDGREVVLKNMGDECTPMVYCNKGDFDIFLWYFTVLAVVRFPNMFLAVVRFSFGISSIFAA
jgi:hypothetical protein